MIPDGDARPFAIFHKPAAEIRDVIAANLGDATIDASDFPRIKIPAGGATNWAIQAPDGEESAKELVVIVLYQRDTRSYWSVPAAIWRRTAFHSTLAQE